MGQDIVGKIVEPGYKLNTLASTYDSFMETIILKSPYNFAEPQVLIIILIYLKKKKVNLSWVMRLLKRLTRNPFCLPLILQVELSRLDAAGGRFWSGGWGAVR